MVEAERLANSVEFKMVDDRWFGNGARAQEDVERKTKDGPIR